MFNMNSWRANDVFVIYDYMRIIGISLRFMYFKNYFRLYKSKKVFVRLTTIKYTFIKNEEFKIYEL